MASGIACASCGASLSLDGDLLARRFLLHASQWHLAPADVIRATSEPTPYASDDEVRLAIDYSRAVHQYLLGCAACLSVTRTDRPARADDVVPGRVSLGLPGAVVVRAARRLESAVPGGRVGRELRNLAADPVRRYAARVPSVFRAAREGFADSVALVADVTATLLAPEHAGPQGLVWDDGSRVTQGRDRLRRLVHRAIPALSRDGRTLPFQHGEVSLWHIPHRHGWVLRFGRGTRLPILGEEPAAFRVGPPRVQWDEPRHERLFAEQLPPLGFVVPLDLVVPA